MHKPSLAAALISTAALPSMADVANATLVTGSTAVAVGAVTPVTTPPGTVTPTNLLNTFNFTLSVGGSTPSENVLSLALVAGKNNQTYTSTVTDTITFTGPGSGTFVDTASLSFIASGSSFGTGSTLKWSNGASGENVTLSDGSVVNINLADIDFSGTKIATSPTATGVLTLVSGPSAIAEPASIAALGVGVFGLGLVRRRRDEG
jgi:hypothetical protein